MQLKHSLIIGAMALAGHVLPVAANPFAAPAPAASAQEAPLNPRAEDAMYERFIDRLQREQNAGRINLGIGELAEGSVDPAVKEVTPEDVLKSISYVGTYSGRHVYRSVEEGCYIHEVQVNSDKTEIIESRCLERTIERMRNSTD